MPDDLAFLHTLAANVQTFGKLATDVQPGLHVRHVVAEDLLAEVAREGRVSEALTRRVQDEMRDAATTGARVVVCTCSTIGGAAEATNTNGRFTAMRIDRPMADRAVRSGSRILIVAALPSTLGPTGTLIQDSARRAGAATQILELPVESAWAHFERGDHEQYLRAISDAIHADGRKVDVILLAQASMAGAADLCTDIGVPVLSSPRLGVEAAVEKLGRIPVARHPE